jgi:hypothetical protein
LHHPKVLTGWINPDYKDKVDDHTPILRKTDEYMAFLFVFGRFGASHKEFKNSYRNTLFADFVPDCMESFLITVYTLNFKYWHKKRREAMGEEESMEQESMSEEPPTQLLARANPDNGGWSDAAYDMYCWITREIKNQRDDSWKFDDDLKNRFIMAQQGGGAQSLNNNGSTSGRDDSHLDNVEDAMESNWNKSLRSGGTGGSASFTPGTFRTL